jgi:hypothetical protein
LKGEAKAFFNDYSLDRPVKIKALANGAGGSENLLGGEV